MSFNQLAELSSFSMTTILKLGKSDWNIVTVEKEKE